MEDEGEKWEELLHLSTETARTRFINKIFFVLLSIGQI
jgi:hypothetical protein